MRIEVTRPELKFVIADNRYGGIPVFQVHANATYWAGGERYTFVGIAKNTGKTHSVKITDTVYVDGLWRNEVVQEYTRKSAERAVALIIQWAVSRTMRLQYLPPYWYDLDTSYDTATLHLFYSNVRAVNLADFYPQQWKKTRKRK